MGKAVLFHEPGGPEVLRLAEVDVPEPGPGEVRVRVRAAGVQPFDVSVVEGWLPAFLTETMPLPRIPGNEFAGVVDAVGAGVGANPLGEPLQVGAEVLGFSVLKAYAEYIVVPAEHVAVKPADMPWEVAGGLNSGAQTASIALEMLGVGKGDTLLVNAAAGNVGTVAVQLARELGATVIGTAREQNHEYLRSLGAIPVAYGPGMADRVRAAAPGGIDAVLDGAGGESLDAALELADPARVITLVDHHRAAEGGIRTTNPALRHVSRLAAAAELYAQGKLKVHVRRTYPLARAADAQREVAVGHGRGKVVLLVP
ncbi:NADP-dependent oxidoreductase [Yinghuangia soli]|uniref:NADP-dependent oxidoreductase n=1 Tax=Yinghuangia soli TaxID=2908204 RepID=A0AA41QAA5_9ACTN|nr:NADP-dependent oxidoreductase [Yinghuangia soli]MCF2533795.1 NADP-dependent oxidoreductase [Yinghuangia soli]